MKFRLDGQILASEASRLQIGAAIAISGGAAQSNVSPLVRCITMPAYRFNLILTLSGPLLHGL